MNESKKNRAKIDEVSSTFCLAKWTEAVVKLHQGRISFCCHSTNSAPININSCNEDIDNFFLDPSIKHQRDNLLKGIKDKACSFCWEQESKALNQSSERYHKSSLKWNSPVLNKFSENKNPQIKPTFLEIAITNKCNLKCIYCSELHSSSIKEENLKYGITPTSEDVLNNQASLKIPPQSELDTHFDLLKKWLSHNIHTLKVINLTGGEPLLSEQLFELLDMIEQNSNCTANLHINTNLQLPKSTIIRFQEQVNRIVISKGIKVHVITSLDSMGKDAEFIRQGLKISSFKENIEILLSGSPGLYLGITASFNIFSIFNFSEVAEYVHELKSKYSNGNNDRVVLTSYLVQFPKYLSPLLAPDLAKRLSTTIEFMKSKSSKNRPDDFHEYEVEMVEKIRDQIFAGLSPTDRKIRLIELGIFTKEILKKRNIDIKKNFKQLDQLLLESEQNFQRFKEEKIPDVLNSNIENRDDYIRLLCATSADKNQLDNTFLSSGFKFSHINLVTYLKAILTLNLANREQRVRDFTKVAYHSSISIKEKLLVANSLFNSLLKKSLINEALYYLAKGKTLTEETSNKYSKDVVRKWIMNNINDLKYKEKFTLIESYMQHISKKEDHSGFSIGLVKLLLEASSNNSFHTILAASRKSQDEQELSDLEISLSFIKNEQIMNKFLSVYKTAKEDLVAEIIQRLIFLPDNKQSNEILLPYAIHAFTKKDHRAQRDFFWQLCDREELFGLSYENSDTHAELKRFTLNVFKTRPLPAQYKVMRFLKKHPFYFHAIKDELIDFSSRLKSKTAVIHAFNECTDDNDDLIKLTSKIHSTLSKDELAVLTSILIKRGIELKSIAPLLKKL